MVRGVVGEQLLRMTACGVVCVVVLVVEVRSVAVALRFGCRAHQHHRVLGVRCRRRRLDGRSDEVDGRRAHRGWILLLARLGLLGNRDGLLTTPARLTVLDGAERTDDVVVVRPLVEEAVTVCARRQGTIAASPVGIGVEVEGSTHAGATVGELPSDGCLDVVVANHVEGVRGGIGDVRASTLARWDCVRRRNLRPCFMRRPSHRDVDGVRLIRPCGERCRAGVIPGTVRRNRKSGVVARRCLWIADDGDLVLVCGVAHGNGELHVRRAARGSTRRKLGRNLRSRQWARVVVTHDDLESHVVRAVARVPTKRVDLDLCRDGAASGNLDSVRPRRRTGDSWRKSADREGRSLFSLQDQFIVGPCLPEVRAADQCDRRLGALRAAAAIRVITRTEDVAWVADRNAPRLQDVTPVVRDGRDEGRSIGRRLVVDAAEAGVGLHHAREEFKRRRDVLPELARRHEAGFVVEGSFEIGAVEVRPSVSEVETPRLVAGAVGDACHEDFAGLHARTVRRNQLIATDDVVLLVQDDDVAAQGIDVGLEVQGPSE